MRERERRRELILENIEYDILVPMSRSLRVPLRKSRLAFGSPPEGEKEPAPAALDLEALVEQLRKSPELANTLAALLSATPGGK